MAEKRCGLGFSCASMMQQAELRVGNCPNLAVCGIAQRLEPDAEFELVRSGSSGIETISVNRQSAAVMMLMRRGYSQSLSSFSLYEQITHLSEQLNQLAADIAHYEDCYIVPAGVEAVSYSVKRPGRLIETPEGMVRQIREYWYNKLMSQSAIFAPAEQEQPVKVIHLSKNNDPRNLEGRRGVARRNQLNQIVTQLRIVRSAIAKARELAAQSSDDE